MRTLIFTVGWGDLYFKLSCMFARSCRANGYTQDLTIFATQDARSTDAKVVNVATHPDVRLLETGRGFQFHRQIPSALGYSPYQGKLDYFIIKTLPGRFVAREWYDFILYCDSDILVKQDLSPIFEHATLVGAPTTLSYFQAVKKLARFIAPDEASIAKSTMCIGSGVFGVPRAHYGFFEDFRQVYTTHLGLIQHDGPALRLTAFRGRESYRPTQLPHGFFGHYWGGAGKKRRMQRDFDRRFGSKSGTDG